jgi:hypothetical protein
LGDLNILRAGTVQVAEHGLMRRVDLLIPSHSLVPAMSEPILIVGIVIICTAWYVRHRWRIRMDAMRTDTLHAPRAPTGLEILALRYARGEIDRGEYLEKKHDIVGGSGVSHSTV